SGLSSMLEALLLATLHDKTVREWNAAIDAGLTRPEKEEESVDDIASNWTVKVEVKGEGAGGAAGPSGTESDGTKMTGEVKSPTEGL
ncbi:hypothetical protein PFISCL1PPCAC_11, partial [Pristionchus fissidentatus]